MFLVWGEREIEMTVMLTRENGDVTPLKNQKYLTAYFFIPEGIRKKFGAELNVIPRELGKLRANRRALETIESDLFLLAIIDAYAYMVWPHITPDTMRMETYSGYDPVWKIAHTPDFWILEMIIQGVIPRTEHFFRFPLDYQYPIIPEEGVYTILEHIVPRAMTRHGLWGVVQTAKNYRCFEDYEDDESFQKIDFDRKWYHTRTKHPMVSYEKFQQDWQEFHGGEEWDIADKSVKTQDEIVSELDIEAFTNGLSNKDRQILQLRRQGQSYEDIAKAVGYKTHSAVGKRLKIIGKLYEDFAKVDLGFRK